MKGNHVEIENANALAKFDNATLGFNEKNGMFVVTEKHGDGSVSVHMFPAAHVLRASETKEGK